MDKPTGLSTTLINLIINSVDKKLIIDKFIRIDNYKVITNH